METLETTFDLIEVWANDRNIIKGSTAKDQFIKLISEFGELCSHADRFMTDLEEDDEYEDINLIKDDIGDTSVVFKILSSQLGLSFNELLYIDSLPDTYNNEILLGSCLGKLGDAILKNDLDTARIFIGLSLQYLTSAAIYYDLDYKDCVESAYKEIKNRKGIMYNGAFIKSTDTKYEPILKELGLEK
jgi:hypothetical protein